MLYTVMPVDQIYASEPPKIEEQTVGMTRLVWQMDGGERKLMRVISTDLKDYLRYRI